MTLAETTQEPLTEPTDAITQESTETENQGVTYDEPEDIKNPDVEETPKEETKEEPKVVTQADVDKMAIRKQNRINKLASEKAEIQRQNEELQQKLQAQAIGVRPTIPPVPDKLDPQFDLKMQARDQAIIASQKYTAIEIQQAQEAKTQKELAAVQQRQAVQGIISQHRERVIKQKVDPQLMIDHENIVATYIKDPDVSSFLLSQDNSPVLISHLASNPQSLEIVAGLSPLNAVAYILQSVVPGIVPAPSAPAPQKRIKGKATGPSKDPFLKDVTYD